MKRILKRTLCLLLTVIIFVSSCAVSYAYTTDDIVKAAREIIFSLEGDYTGILANDNGAVSIGRIGWHGSRALGLLRTIVEANKKQAEDLLGSELYNEILTAKDSDWNTRVLSSEESKAVAKLLATDESKAAQDALAYYDINSYVTHGRSLGITDGRALVYFADIENQMGSFGSERVAKAAIERAGSASSVTLLDLHNAAMADTTAGSSPIRRQTTYEYCRNLKLDGTDVTGSSYKTGQYRIATASDPLRVRSGPGVSFESTGISLPKGTVVTVTQISGDWGKITYGGVTGWINLLYAAYIGDSVGSSGGTMGDLNGNGKVDAADARLALRASAKLVQLTEEQKKIADVDGDSRITAVDARIILRVSAKLQSF